MVTFSGQVGNVWVQQARVVFTVSNGDGFMVFECAKGLLPAGLRTVEVAYLPPDDGGHLVGSDSVVWIQPWVPPQAKWDTPRTL